MIGMRIKKTSLKHAALGCARLVFQMDSKEVFGHEVFLRHSLSPAT